MKRIKDIIGDIIGWIGALIFIIGFLLAAVVLFPFAVFAKLLNAKIFISTK